MSMATLQEGLKTVWKASFFSLFVYIFVLLWSYETFSQNWREMSLRYHQITSDTQFAMADLGFEHAVNGRMEQLWNLLRFVGTMMSKACRSTMRRAVLQDGSIRCSSQCLMWISLMRLQMKNWMAKRRKPATRFLTGIVFASFLLCFQKRGGCLMSFGFMMLHALEAPWVSCQLHVTLQLLPVAVLTFSLLVQDANNC